MLPRIPDRPSFNPAELAIRSHHRTRMPPVLVAEVLEGSADQAEEAGAEASAATDRADVAGVTAGGNAAIAISSRGSSATEGNPTGSMAWCFSI
jgi:hypothetical protein